MKVRHVNTDVQRSVKHCLAFFDFDFTSIGTKKGSFLSEGRHSRLGGAVAPNCLPGSATAEVLCLSTNPKQCILQVSGNALQEVRKFKYLGVVAFLRVTEGGVRIDTRIGKVNAVLLELYRSVVTKRSLSNTTKLLVFKLVFVPVINLG